MKLGLSLSGGGVRATVFHLGVLARVANTDYWDSLKHISTVSGGSLGTALIYSKSGYEWPKSDFYLNHCLPSIYLTLTKVHFQGHYIFDTLTKPWRLFQGRAHLIAKLIEKHWHIKGLITDIPTIPRWTINSTCYETGKNWRFSYKRMGDYKANYVLNPSFPISDAIASSAAVPGVIGPLKLITGKYKWKKYSSKNETIDVEPISKTLTLWDGGVYDNLGVEALFKPNTKLHDDIDHLLVSDASVPVENVNRNWIQYFPIPKIKLRLIDIALDQIRGLRARQLFSYFSANHNGGYIKLSESVEQVLTNLKYQDIDKVDFAKCMDSELLSMIATFPTTLRRLSTDEFTLLFRHGFETANAVLAGTRGEPFMYFDDINFKWLNNK